MKKVDNNNNPRVRLRRVVIMSAKRDSGVKHFRVKKMRLRVCYNNGYRPLANTRGSQ